MNFSKDELRIEACETKESARRLICKVMAYENDKKNFKDEDIDDENIYNSDWSCDDEKKTNSWQI